ncbi:MAG: hypothetical protein ACI3ZG_07055 [Candidatus Coprenecus sp.]
MSRKLFLKSVVIFSVLFMIYSCVKQEFDPENLNTEITIAGDGITIPLGNTLPVKSSDLLKKLDSSLVCILDDGTLALTISDSTSLGEYLPDISSMISFPDIGAETSFDVPFIVLPEEISIDISQKFEITVIVASQVRPEIVAIDHVIFNDVYFVLDYSLLNIPETGAAIDFDANLQVEMPSIILLDQNDSRVNGNIVTLTAPYKNGRFDVDPIRIEGFSLAEYDFSSGTDLTKEIVISGKINVSGEITDPSVLGTPITNKMNIGIENISISNISGKIDYKTDPISKKINLDNLPEFLKNDDICLDLYNPYILIDATTNIGIPMQADVVINGAIDASIEFPVSSSCHDFVSEKYWLGINTGDIPKDFTFVEIENLSSILKPIPDELNIILNANTIKEEKAFFETAASYDMDVKYQVVLPFAFGNDFSFVYKDSIAISKDISDALKATALQLGGKFINGFPLQFDLEVCLIDQDNNSIELEKPAFQRISSCNPDGTPSESKLNLDIKLKDNKYSGTIKAIGFKVSATPEDAVGVSLNKDAYLQIFLTATFPEGITLDLENYK